MTQEDYLAMDQEIQHAIALSANFETSFNPIQLGCLEEFCSFKLTEKVFLGHSLPQSTVMCIVYLEQNTSEVFDKKHGL